MKISRLNRMYILSFIFSLHIAISAYVNSTFLTKIISERYVGIIFALSSLITLVFLSQSVRILKHFGNRKAVIILLMVNALSLGIIMTSLNPVVIGLAFICFLTTNTLVFFCIDIFIEHFGDEKTIGKTRGLYLVIINLAYLVSPIITGWLITKDGGYKTIYVLAFMIVMLATIGLMSGVRSFHDSAYAKTPFLKTYKFLKTNRHIFAITVINFLLQFFYVWMTIYTPIYLVEHLGFNWSQIGIIFTIMLLPFVLLGYPMGLLIDKYHIHKRTLIAVGITILGVATLLIACISTTSITVWAIMLFVTRIGATMVETVCEVYFFTHVREKDAHLLSVFRDMVPVAYLIAPILGTVFLTFFPFKYLFIALGIICLSGLYYVPRLIHPSDKIHLSNQN